MTITDVVFPPDLDATEMIESISATLAKARARSEALERFEGEVRQRKAGNDEIVAGLESSLAAATGEAAAMNGKATPPPTQPKASRRPPTATRAKKQTKPKRAKRVETPAEELLRACGPRAYDAALTWARGRSDFVPEDFEPPEGVSLQQTRTAFRALRADGALAKEANGRWHFVREPTLLSFDQRLIAELTDGPKTQAELIKVLDSNQTTVSRTVRRLAQDGRLTNTPQGANRLVSLVGAFDGAA